jgi:hypothetical protein
MNSCSILGISILRHKLIGFGLSVLGWISSSCVGFTQTPVAFDVPAIVVAEPVNPAITTAPMTGGDLYRLRFTVSTYLSPEYRGSITDYAIELQSPTQSLRVIDFWPKNETYTPYEGTVKVDANRQKDEHFAFNLSAAYPAVAEASASGDYRNQLNIQESYIKKPPMQTLTSSGTIHQGYGVFYKFRPGPVDVLEGSKEVAILVEAPKGWRADLLQVVMTAAGTDNNGNSPRVISQSRLWITTHREGDEAAAAQAQVYVHQERRLRGMAASQQGEIAKRSYPSFWHKAGAAINVVDSRIPSDYLVRVIFGRANRAFDDGSNRLPVDLRVVILDYWEQRDLLLSLSRGNILAVSSAKLVSN